MSGIQGEQWSTHDRICREWERIGYHDAQDGKPATPPESSTIVDTHAAYMRGYESGQA